MARLTVKIHFAWWLPFYKWALVATVYLTGATPDWDKVTAMVERAVRYRVVKES